MTPGANRSLMRTVCVAWLLMAASWSAGQESVDRRGPLFFVGMTGEGTHGQHKVLLRWYSTQGEIPFSEFSLYRKAGGPHDPGSYSQLTTTGKLRNIPLIRSIFERQGEKQIYDDLLDVLDSMSDSEVSKEDYVYRLLDILDDRDTCEACAMRANFLVQSNYGVSIVEGLGYIDRVTPGTYSYELRTPRSDGTGELVIGRITIDASTIVPLPAPTQPEEVVIEGLRGDRKVFLRWDVSSGLESQSPINFGFNVYRYDGFPAAGDTFEILLSSGQLTKINRLPIMLGGVTVDERPEDERYDFMDDNLSFDKEGRLGTEFTVGNQLTYWIVARDLLGQNGDPSLPIKVVVKDRKAPPIPKGLDTIEERVGEDRRIVLQWDSNADGDTVGYHLYRYRYYHHMGRFEEAFADETSLTYSVTEGLTAVVPESATSTVYHRDTEIGLPDDEGRAYWYCVAAVDAAGNRSPLSAPVRGVLFDRAAPEPPEVIKICTSRLECDAKFTEKKSESLPDRTDVVFQIERMDSRIVAARVVKLYGGKRTTVYRGRFGDDFIVTVTDTVRLDTDPVEDDLRYEFTFKTALGDWCGPFEMPEEWRVELIQSRSKRFKIKVQVYIHARTICVDATEPGRIPHDPQIDGNISPLTVTVALTADAVGAALYRAEDCTDFRRITSQYASEGDTEVTLVDTLRPGSAAMICYGVRLFDENNNLSGMTYLDSHIVFEGDESILPVLNSIDAAGTASLPEARLKWFGPEEGISGYRVYFATGTMAKSGAISGLGGTLINNTTAVSSVYPLDDLSYQDSTGLWSIQLSSLDTSGSIPLQTNLMYRVWIEAVDLLGNAIESKNSMLFTWSDIDKPEERLDWPIRSLPDSTDGLPVSTSVPDTDWVIRGVGIQLTDPEHSPNVEVNPIDIMVVDTPFIVYRKRVDSGNQPYVQIGPLIEEIHLDPSTGVIQDPFIIPYGFAAYYMDYVGLVAGATYRYIVVEMDANGELSLVRGPTADVEIDFE